jgi:PAS domain S-box-containing protein
MRSDVQPGELVEHLPLALLLVNSRGEIEFVNRSCEKLLGYGRGALVGQRIELLVPARSRPVHEAYVESFLRSPSVRGMGVGRDVVALHQDGHEIPVEIGLAPVSVPGGLAIVASLIDITARKEDERRLRQSNRDLERFAYVTSHDLQAPLRQVAGFAKLLQEDLANELTGESKENLEFLLEATNRMQRLIQALLAFSRVQSAEVQRASVDLGEVLATVLATLAADVEQTGSKIEAEDLPRVVGNRDQLEMVFQNLIANALKFRADGRPPIVRILARRVARSWRLEIADNGIGFEEKYAEEIFQMFRRLEDRLRFPGTGIGLALVRRIVEAHGGRIWAEASRGAGARFILELPDKPSGG